MTCYKVKVYTGSTGICSNIQTISPKSALPVMRDWYDSSICWHPYLFYAAEMPPHTSSHHSLAHAQRWLFFSVPPSSVSLPMVLLNNSLHMLIQVLQYLQFSSITDRSRIMIQYLQSLPAAWIIHLLHNRILLQGYSLVSLCMYIQSQVFTWGKNMMWAVASVM